MGTIAWQDPALAPPPGSQRLDRARSGPEGVCDGVIGWLGSATPGVAIVCLCAMDHEESENPRPPRTRARHVSAGVLWRGGRLGLHDIQLDGRHASPASQSAPIVPAGAAVCGCYRSIGCQPTRFRNAARANWASHPRQSLYPARRPPHFPASSAPLSASSQPERAKFHIPPPPQKSTRYPLEPPLSSIESGLTRAIQRARASGEAREDHRLEGWG